MEPKKKYGFLTATAMVVGSVIGSGVFFKAETLSRITEGDIKIGILAWSVGGLVMLLCLGVFVLLADAYPGEGGTVLYAKETLGEGYSYYMGWFTATLYYPSLVSVLSWLSARYTLLFFGIDDDSGGLCMLLSCFFLVCAFYETTFLGDLSGKVQVITSGIKLIPLVVMIVFGIVKGIGDGTIRENLGVNAQNMGGALFPGITSVAFAYEGWIAATGIGGEIKNSRRNLPLALITGGVTVATVYILYYIGISGTVPTRVFMENPSGGINLAFSNLIGNGAGRVLTAFVAVSCMGALNGLSMGNGRAMYNLAKTQKSPCFSEMARNDKITKTPVRSSVTGLIFSMLWLFFYYGARISETPLFMGYGFDSSELCVVSAYGMYIPIFIAFIKKHYVKKKIKNFFLPLMGIFSCIFLIVCAVYAHKSDVTDYLFTFSAVMLLGEVFRRK